MAIEQQHIPNIRLIGASAFAAFGSTFTMGYQMTAFNEPSKIFMDFVNQSSYQTHTGYIKNSQLLAGVWAFIISTFLIGQFFGALCVPFFADRFGRKTSLLVHTSIMNITGCLLLGIAKPTGVFELLILGRLITGYCSGLGGGLLAMYLSECSPDHFRAVIGNMQNLFITSSTFVGSLLGLHYVLGTEENWPYLVVLPAFFNLLQILISPLLPESPKYLYIQLEDHESAEKSINFYHGATENTAHVFDTFDAEQKLETRHLTFLEVMRSNHLRWSATLSFLVPAASMLSGIMALFSYSTQIFNSIHISPTLSQWTTVIMSGCNTLGGLLAIPMMDRLGRRPLVLGGILLTMLCNLFFMISDKVAVAYDVTKLHYLSLALVVVHVTVFNMSVGPVAWFYSSEVSPQAARSTCTSIALVSNSLFALIQNLVVPPLLDIKAIGSYVFLVMIVPSFFLGIFLSHHMPETRDKSVDEILSKWWQEEDEAAAAAHPDDNLSLVNPNEEHF